MSWNKINKELEKKLKNYKFKFDQANVIIGCDEKTLRRYISEQLICPIKISDEWQFSQEQIDKCTFIYKAKKLASVDIATSAGIYDYYKSQGMQCDFDKIFPYIQNYWSR